jgi:hypothetical protein
MKYTAEMASLGTIYTPSFMTTESGIQVILRLLPKNYKGCRVDITDGRDLLTKPPRWSQVA